MKRKNRKIVKHCTLHSTLRNKRQEEKVNKNFPFTKWNSSLLFSDSEKEAGTSNVLINREKYRRNCYQAIHEII